MNRGAGRQDVFRARRDGRTFLHFVGDAAQHVGVEVHSFCLMGNHFHLLLRCPHLGISDFMHRVTAPYVRYFNERVGRDGPLFRSRFHSIALGSSEYVRTVGRYIHRNPLDVRPPVALDAYPWSSYRYFVSAQPRPAWLVVDMLLGESGSRGAYREFVEGTQRNLTIDWGWAVATAVDELVDDPRRRANVARSAGLALLDVADPRRLPEIERWLRFPSMEARAMALLRMRRRRETDPIVGEIARRAVRLAV